MSEQLRYPKLDDIYHQYLNDENSAQFIESVSSNYTIPTIEKLARFGQRLTRRASILALGFLGDYGCNEVMGLALIDKDRAVRLLADHGIREIWHRQGTVAQQESVKRLYRLVDLSRMEEAVDLSTQLIEQNPELGEAWHQRAIAFCHEGHFEEAIEDCRETLNCNRFHFPAAMGLAQCCLQLNDPVSALDGFRLALKINPDLDGIRQQVSHLERILDEK